MVNEQIRAREIRVISDEGEQLGIMGSRNALAMAKEKGLDLVMVSPNAVPPVCRIMDYGRHKYETEKKNREAKKKQHIVMLKEITLSYKIGEHDYQVRKRSIERFLVEGNKVKVTIRLRGREEQHADMAAALLRRFHTDTQELGVMEREPRLEGRHVIMILAPRKENK
jgi:translation initiation factor IF-3